MPRHDGNTHRGPSHRRRCGHTMKRRTRTARLRMAMHGAAAPLNQGIRAKKRDRSESNGPKLRNPASAGADNGMYRARAVEEHPVDLTGIHKRGERKAEARAVGTVFRSEQKG